VLRRYEKKADLKNARRGTRENRLLASLGPTTKIIGVEANRPS
jgi:hypothetical protein